MNKYVTLLCLLGSILLLALALPINFSGQSRDPVPDNQKVAHSSHCIGCHGVDEDGLAMVDKDGKDVSISDDWQFSMMGFAARDPFWRATVVDEVNHFPAAQAAIESTCLKCHAPLGHFEAKRNNLEYTYQMMLADSLGLDGVSCSACHQQSTENLGQFFSGNYTLDTNRLIFGQFPNPFQGPMQIYVGFDPVFSDHIYDSGICAGCHTLITETLHPDGTPSGDYFVEQATYHEWLNSSYPAQGKECQTCHLPFIQEGVIIATDLAALEARQPYGLHQFFGANTAMLEMMRENQKELGLPKPETDHAWDESIENNRKSLSSSGQLTVTAAEFFNDTLYVQVDVKNNAGHKLPSGYPSRIAWLEVTLRDASSNETLYSNGALDAEGNIQGRDFPFEPHHQISKSADDVQIYELVMSNLGGHVTTRLNAAYQPLKDNRLLPLGFKTNHSTYDTVAVWGTATTDPDYNASSAAGRDHLEYRIPLQGKKGMAQLNITLHYQTLPSRWMNELFEGDTLDEVAQFKSMYQGYQTHKEVIDEVKVDSIDISTTSLAALQDETIFSISPNPVSGTTIYLSFDERITLNKKLTYQIISPDGVVLQSGDLQKQIGLNHTIQPGVYYIALTDRNKLFSIKPFIVL